MSLMLAAKAEVVFGVCLVLRHRTARLAGALVLVTVGLTAIRDLPGSVPVGNSNVVLVLGGTLATVFGSRLLAPGAALAAARQVAAEWWLVPVGRLVGAIAVVLPAILVAVFVVDHPDVGNARLCLTVTIYAAAMASITLAVTPVVGASGAATLGFVAAWAGAIPPPTVGAALVTLPRVRHLVLLLWHCPPLPWRAGRMLSEIVWSDLIVLSFWVVVGVLSAAWATRSVLPTDRHSKGRPE